MADERGMIVGDRVEARLDRIEQGINALTQRVSRVEGLIEGFKIAFDQMEKRLSTMQWGLGLLVVIQVLILGKLFLK